MRLGAVDYLRELAVERVKHVTGVRSVADEMQVEDF